MPPHRARAQNRGARSAGARSFCHLASVRGSVGEPCSRSGPADSGSDRSTRQRPSSRTIGTSATSVLGPRAMTIARSPLTRERSPCRSNEKRSANRPGASISHGLTSRPLNCAATAERRARLSLARCDKRSNAARRVLGSPREPFMSDTHEARASSGESSLERSHRAVAIAKASAVAHSARRARESKFTAKDP